MYVRMYVRTYVCTYVCTDLFVHIDVDLVELRNDKDHTDTWMTCMYVYTHLFMLIAVDLGEAEQLGRLHRYMYDLYTCSYGCVYVYCVWSRWSWRTMKITPIHVCIYILICLCLLRLMKVMLKNSENYTDIYACRVYLYASFMYICTAVDPGEVEELWRLYCGRCVSGEVDFHKSQNTLQHIATHCNTLQHTAAHYVCSMWAQTDVYPVR